MAAGGAMALHVAPPSTWPKLLRYLVVVRLDGGDECALVLIKQVVCAAGAGEEARLGVSVRVGQTYECGIDERTLLPTLGKRSRLMGAFTTFDYSASQAIEVRELHVAACERHARGARVDVGRRNLFEAGRWPGAEAAEPYHAQLLRARRVFEASSSADSRGRLSCARRLCKAAQMHLDLAQRWEVEDEGPLKDMLGVEVQRNRMIHSASTRGTSGKCSKSTYRRYPRESSASTPAACFLTLSTWSRRWSQLLATLRSTPKKRSFLIL